MKFKKLFKILYVIIPLLVILIAAIDLLSYYSNLSITIVSYLREIIILSIIFVWYKILKEHLHFDELTIEQNLVRLSILIVGNFLIAVGLHTIFSPNYSSGFPVNYNSPSAIFVSTILAFTAAITFVPAILILKQLIFYKRKRKTALIFNLYLLAITINAISVFVTKEPVGWFRFSRETLANDISFSFTILLILILSFRNEWITYLSRKKKLLYFFAGIPIYIGIASLFDVAYKTPLPAYSLSIAALSYALWLFLVIYFAISLIKLLFHLPTARAFDRKIRELNSLYDLGRMLNSETKLKKLIPLITKSTSEFLQSDSTWLELYEDNDEKFNIASHLNLTKNELSSFPLSSPTGLNRAVIQKKGPFLINDVSHNRAYRDLLEWKKDARAILGAPLFNHQEDLMGIIYATKVKEYTFDIDDASLLQGVANQASIALENARLLQESIERERMEQELRIARDVQIKLLPQKLPQIPNFDVDASCLMAYEVGGDYYDFFRFADGNYGLVLGDVSGKGTSAALYMAEFKGIIQTLAQSYNSPHELASAANRIVYPNIERRTFVSAIFAKINSQDKSVTVARAGHTPLIYIPVKNKTPQSILTSGIGVGLDNGDKFEMTLKEETICMEPGDTAIFYTDGVTEARNSRGEEFGEDRLLDHLKNCNSNSANDIKENLLKFVVDFCGDTPLHDDLTFSVLKCCK